MWEKIVKNNENNKNERKPSNSSKNSGYEAWYTAEEVIGIINIVAINSRTLMRTELAMHRR